MNELSYGDKTLLFADGEFIRVTLVLGKPASPYMKSNLAEFVGKFEIEYNAALPQWRGQIDQFQGAGALVDDILKTSIILPHQLVKDNTLAKKISSALGIKLAEIAKGLVSDDRPFLFLAQILERAMQNTAKSAGEIILSMNNLLEIGILKPIKIEDIQKKEELTAAQLQHLRTRIWQIPNKTEQEKESLLEQMRKLPKEEHEVIIQSMTENIAMDIEELKLTTPSYDLKDEAEAKNKIREI